MISVLDDMFTTALLTQTGFFLVVLFASMSEFHFNTLACGFFFFYSLISLSELIDVDR